MVVPAMSAQIEECLCPALFFCAPASGQGKTTITAGIARYHQQQGLDVRVFKTGPDYLDPLILEAASGKPVVQLDLWMVGEERCKAILYEAAQEADLILIEGVMGMFDGKPSGADMAEYFGIPIAIVIDARSMAQTFAALAVGLSTFRPELKISGVIANSVGSDRHKQLITDAMPSNLAILGYMRRTEDAQLPERHLGLVRPQEQHDIDIRLDRIATVVHEAGLTALPNNVYFRNGTVESITPQLQDRTIAVARDDAFCFVYAANIKLLEDMGATCVFFSPLANEPMPKCDALWLPGGYPELHHRRLAANQLTMESIRTHHRNEKPILADCGGMLYIMQTLTDVEGHQEKMSGLIPGDGIMRTRGGCQGMQYAGFSVGEFRAHAHHRTRCENALEPIAFGRRTRHPAPGEPIYEYNGIFASYLHLYFLSNPTAIAKLFG